ncbi:MAG: deoxyribodipyrimidine photo-lyase [Chakrabartia sp.]
MPSIFWFRQDLRLHDNPALTAACAEGAVVPVYILDDDSAGERRMGGASRWWLHHSLSALQKKLPNMILRRGNAVVELMQIAAQTGATRVHANAQYEPWWREAESELTAEMDLVLHHGNQLIDPTLLLTGGGGRYKVFTPWWRNLVSHMPPAKPLIEINSFQLVTDIISDNIDDWNLLPNHPNWAQRFDVWTPGEEGARAAFRAFLPKIADYNESRNLPSVEGISRLSPHLHFGEVSPATLWHHASKAAGAQAESFLREVGWRDYATNLIDQFPDYGWVNGRRAYDNMPWRTGAKADADFDAWTKGKTGYPIVDAGMRELWATGFMHNRVRMIAASFLIKHLLIDWRRGEKWFWDTLVDADYAANASNWQWVAGTGVDAPMMSRIMAPLSQSEKFGARDYVRQWVPELAALDDPYIHDPDEFGQRPRNYPAKIIGHREARERALSAIRSVRDGLHSDDD